MSPGATWRALLVSAIAAIAGGEAASAAGNDACDALPAQEAAALMGAPLESNFRNESQPDSVNGHDHTTVCGWFPKGYNLSTADKPPERGVQLTLHTFRSQAEAKQFHMMTKNGPPGAKLKPVPGIGDDAVMEEKSFHGTNVATVRFVKGTHSAQVQTWRKDKSGVDAATAAAKQAAAKL